MKILQAILAIQHEIHAVGVGKTRKNLSQGFNFRGIDDALMAFAPLLTINKVLLSPSYTDIVMTERDTAKGGKMYNVTLAGRFKFTHAEDGSVYEVGPFYGEASDSGDKAVSKAESVAERQMFFLSFVVPHEGVIGGDPDQYGQDDEATEASSNLAAWLDAIKACATAEELAARKRECVTAYGMADKVPTSIRTAFVSRTKELSA